MSDVKIRQSAYQALCETEASIPLFSQAWWLDAAVGPEAWDVALVRKGERIEAALPFYVRQRFGITVLTVPNLTPALGPWLRPYAGKSNKRIARQKSLLTDLFQSLPPHDLYQQNWHVDQQNWQPLYWKGYEQSTGYTYRLEDLSDTDAIWRAMDQNNRNDIRKARDREGVRIRQAVSTKEAVDVCGKTFERQGLSVPYSESYVESLVSAAERHGAVDLLVAEGQSCELHAAAIIVYGPDTAYYIMGGGDPEHRNSGAASLILWEAIQRSSERVKIFDFEGSMIEPIERFFRGFGGRQTPYMSIRRAASWKGQAYLGLQRLKQVRRMRHSGVGK
ncbi:GNAT family N-acetyltransferase [Roseovarius nubinhibens]|uniref:BioF2-like acetyltransferase domain-containing protein n=1 Tax=Roseovarius nubinhibens (strain ATCC BAA-591 / DSM 15170 / ISM) TaxID=89187 RepID=A3SJ06_ROSNI|nr:GNAT family N-acetyltransferase [Roseovarius nubinhibens]EAP77337.1 hypothetical protein ISM_03570 [Roseovarius nubinhibens ISM]